MYDSMRKIACGTDGKFGEEAKGGGSVPKAG